MSSRLIAPPWLVNPFLPFPEFTVIQHSIPAVRPLSQREPLTVVQSQVLFSERTQPPTAGRIVDQGGAHDGGHTLPLSPSPADCPQVQCVHPYVAQQPDELTLELADILNILEKTEDGEAPSSLHLGQPREKGL